MTVAEIYHHFKIMPNLQTHMLRVAGVGKIVAQAQQRNIDVISVVQACLLHDLGNIIKFNLEIFPEFLQPKGLVYWQNVQTETRQKYGEEEHSAALKMASEIGATSRVQELIAAIDFSKAQENFESDDWEAKICVYADNRVTPHGVVTLDERLQDLEDRYQAKYPSPEQAEYRKIYRGYLHKIEDHLFSQTQLNPDEITEKSVEELFSSLKEEVI